MKSEDIKTQKRQRQIAWFVLIYGFVVMGGGIFGIWMQGMFWDVSANYLVMADQLLHSEVVESFCLPTIVTSVGGLAIAWVILASKLTERFSSKRKNLIFVVFVVVYVVAVFVPAKIAGSKMWSKAQEVERKYNTPRSVGTNP
jgi:hypothetical protein